MKPVERRLLREARAARLPLALTVGAGLAGAPLLVAQAALLAHVVARAFLGHAGLGELAPWIGLLAAAAVGRGLTVSGARLAGHEAAATIRTRLRRAASERALALGDAARGSGEVSAALTAGVEALDGYFAGYLPQLVLAVAVPALVLAWTAPRDPLSAATMAATLPLVPVFMALVGLAARQSAERRWRVLSVLSGHFLDVVQGLPTLRAFGRGRAQEAVIASVGARYRAETMATLRVAFLSSLVLELAATIGTALVAVGIGLRLVAGTFGLETGLAVLVLTPELYVPLRRLGAQFHASLEALAPAERVFALLDTPVRDRGGRLPAPDLHRATVRLESVEFAHPDRGPVLRGASLELRPGERVALVGPSGAGKTTLAGLLLGLLEPDSGRVTAAGQPLAATDLEDWRRQIAWVPQRPGLFHGTVADNVREGCPDATDEDVREALAAAGLDLPPDTPAGERGGLLSAGQRQRVAIARALVRRSPLLVLDEPTANLDVRSRDELGRLLRAGRESTVLLITHSPALTAAADRVVRLEDGRLVEERRALEAAG